MEGMPSFEYRPRRESFLEQHFSLDQQDFERHTGLRAKELTRFAYAPQTEAFREVAQTEQRRGLEVMYHADTSTLVVPPPTPGTISLKDLPVMALPVVSFIDKTQPDVVVGCDRGARIYALAVHNMWSKLKAQEQRFPTLDGKMHFARLSTSLGLDVTSEALARIMNASAQEADRQGTGMNGDRLRLMFIDDWIYSGRTRDHILSSLDSIGVLSDTDVSFAVMCGPGADASGSKQRASVSWQDNPNVIGVNYTKDGKPIAVRTDEAKQIRDKLYRETRRVVAKLA